MGKYQETAQKLIEKRKNSWQMQTKDPGRSVQTAGSNTWRMQTKDTGRPEQRAGSKTWQMGTGPLSLYDRLMQAATKGSLSRSDINRASSSGKISTKEFRKIYDEFERRRWGGGPGSRPADVPNKPVR